MVIVGGSFEVDPDQREQFIAGRLAMMRASRGEQGCLEYSFCADPIDPARVVLYERWASQADLDAHLAALRSTPSTIEPDIQAISASILIYDVSGERQLGR
jgi:quinol monooxygenase YgiN